MSLHYNAFISYKHAPADIAVARDIQHQLEHYRIPRSIREKTEIEKIERIFRDQEELPITSDLSKDIDEALQDADFLIVICSTSTKLSTWVPREIARFLEYHDRDHILTVLVDGEPGEVIPRILLEETDAEIADSGEEQEGRRIFEPLSCDYRTGIRQARKTEIPRLAAALLGCSYDELVMRARQYKMRRLTAFFTAGAVLAAAAIAYLIWSNGQIQSNYEQAEANRVLAEENYQKAEENRLLAEENYEKAEENYAQARQNLEQARRNQSTFLSNEALKQIEKENRILAAQLALAALPSGERTDWPYTAKAEYALAKAISAYCSDSSNANDYKAIWDLEMQGKIRDFRLIRELNLLYAYNSLCEISGWKIDEFKTLFTVDTGLELKRIRTLIAKGGPYLMAQSDTSVLLLNGETGKILWTFEGDPFDPEAEPVSLSAYVFDEELYVFETDSFALKSENYLTVIHLDPLSGTVLWKSETLEIQDLFGDVAGMDAETGRLYFVCNNGKKPVFYCCDLASGEVSVFPLETSLLHIYNITALSGGRLLIFGTDDPAGGTYELMGYLKVIKQFKAAALCCEEESGNTVWTSSLSSYGYNYISAEDCIKKMDGYKDPDGNRHDLFGILYANEVRIFDQADGQLYEDIALDAPITGIAGYRDSSGFLLMLENGNMVGYKLDKDFTVSQLCFGKETQRVLLCFPNEERMSFISLSDPGRMQLYDLVYDDDYTLFEDSGEYGSGRTSLCSGKWLYILEDSRLDIYDLEQDKRVCQLSLETMGPSAKMLGTDPGQRYLYISDSSGIAAVDAQAGRVIQTLDFEDLANYQYNNCLCGSRIYLMTRGKSFQDYALLPLLIGEDGMLSAQDAVPVPAEMMPFENSYPYNLAGDENGSALMLSLIDTMTWDFGTYLLYDTEGGQWQELADPPAEKYLMEAFHAGKKLASVSDEARIQVYGYDGTPLYSIKEDNKMIKALHFCAASDNESREDLLLAVFSDDDTNLLHCYRAETGEFLGSHPISYYTGAIHTQDWIFTEGELILQMDDVINIIDGTEWAMKADIQNAAAYSEEYRKIITFNTRGDANIPQVFSRYSLEDLIEKGNEFIKGAELSDSEKAYYGIEN